MGMFFGIAFLAISFVLITTIFVIRKESEDIVPVAWVGAIIMAFLIAGITLIDEHCSPSITPIDVYRGKTTLEITYRHGVAIDSVVVWKY